MRKAIVDRKTKETDIHVMMSLDGDETEIDTAVSAGAKIIGVNNRNLKDFTVNMDNAARLRDRIPPDCIYVAESGVRAPEDVEQLRRIGADAVLIGETLMRAPDPADMLRSLKGDMR